MDRIVLAAGTALIGAIVGDTWRQVREASPHRVCLLVLAEAVPRIGEQFQPQA